MVRKRKCQKPVHSFNKIIIFIFCDVFSYNKIYLAHFYALCVLCLVSSQSLKRYLEQPTLLESLSARSLGAQRYMKRLYSQIKLWSEVGSEMEWYIADSSAYVVRV